MLTALTTTPIYRNAYRIHAALAPTLKRLGFRDPPRAERADERRSGGWRCWASTASRPRSSTTSPATIPRSSTRRW
ncbi:MAG: hypothetical protein WDM84_05830 [Bauldia sp.]